MVQAPSSSHATMPSSSLRQWNVRQLSVLQRYCSIHHVALTPDLVCSLASRYATKHAGERPRSGSDGCPHPVTGR